MILPKIEFKELKETDIKSLSMLMMKEEYDYNKYFIPFSFDEASIKNEIMSSINDIYYGVFLNNFLVGFYMLRGFDKGFNIPSYGVWISSKYSRKGISKLTLQHAITTCKLLGVKKIMLKVHPHNLVAKSIYVSFGFKEIGLDERINNIVYEKDI